MQTYLIVRIFNWLIDWLIGLCIIWSVDPRCYAVIDHHLPLYDIAPVNQSLLLHGVTWSRRVAVGHPFPIMHLVILFDDTHLSNSKRLLLILQHKSRKFIFKISVIFGNDFPSNFNTSTSALIWMLHWIDRLIVDTRFLWHIRRVYANYKLE